MSDASGVARLEFALLGRFEVRSDGRLLTDREVGSRKARTLLKLLLVERGRVVSTDELVDALWGDAPPSRPGDNVATLVSRLRGTLGAPLIEGARSGYTIAGEHRSDVSDAEQLTTEAEARLAAAEPGIARAAADRAIALLSVGPMLVDEPDAAWADEARRRGDRLLRRARGAAWAASLALGDLRAAREVAEDVAVVDPFDEEAQRVVMLTHWRGGEPARALTVYGALRAQLADAVGADPGAETEALYLSILQDVEAVDDGTAPAPGAPSVGTQPSGFVGRAPELAALSAWWEGAAAGQPRLALVVGEAGIGKTRLVSELGAIAGATGGLVLEARCYEAERSLFLQPVAEILRAAVSALRPDVVRQVVGEWAGTLSQLVPELTELLRPASYAPRDGDFERRRTFEAVASVLERLAADRPLLISIDDLQHAGASTVELLHYVARRSRTAKVLMVATIRPDEGEETLGLLGDVATLCELGPLSSHAIAELADTMGVPHLAEPVRSLTGGHTLYVVEALRAVAEGPSTGANEAMPVPQSLREAVLTRVRRAGDDCESLLRGAVVLGAAFDVARVAALLGIPVEDALRRAERALRARLLVEVGGTYEFSNDLVRDVIYDSTPAPTRVTRHRAAADLVSDNPEAVARHASAAGDWARAVDAWIDAAGRASARFANRDAERILTEALAGAAQVEDPTAEARVRIARGSAREQLADYAGAHDDHSVALELARALADAELEAIALERLGWTAYYERDARSADAFAGRARELAEAAASARAVRPSALLLAGRLRHWHGDLAGAEQVLRDALATAESAAVVEQAHYELGAVLAHQDRWDEAHRELASASLEGAVAFRTLLSTLFFDALALAQMGDLGGALAQLERKQQLLDRFEVGFYRARTATTTAWVYAQAGDWDRASDLADQALGIYGADITSPGGASELHERGHAHLAVAECLIHAGDPAAATTHLDAVTSLLGVDLPFEFRWGLRLTDLRAALDPSVYELLLEQARARGVPKYEAIALAGLGRPDEAAAVARRLGSDLLLARVASPPEAEQAADRVAAGLPDDLRELFVRVGPPRVEAARP